MRRDLWILTATACFGAATAWADRVMPALASMDTFRVVDVEVQGLRYLSRATVLDLLAIGPETSVWEPTEIWADRIGVHPLVKSARVSRRLPDGLIVVVKERLPIALAPTPTLEAVDAEGYRLPVDPARHRLDLPVITAATLPPSSSRLFPVEVRRLAGEVSHLMSLDTAFLQMVSSVRWAGRGALSVRWTEPSVDFLLPTGTSPARLREGLGALSDALARSPDEAPIQIDLRFADQVVVRRGSGE